MSALPNNKNTAKLQQPNSLNNNKGLNNASMLNTKNLPKPVNTSMGYGSNQSIAQVSSSTLANGANNNNQGISKDYINGIARDFSKTSSIKEKLALAKWLNKFAATARGKQTVSLNTPNNIPNAQPSTENKPSTTTQPKVGEKGYVNPNQRTYDKAHGISGDEIADQNQSIRQRWEAREAKGLNNLSREDYDRLSKEKVTYYDENGKPKEYAKYYGGYTQNGGFLNEMKIPKGMMTKEQYEAQQKTKNSNNAGSTGSNNTGTSTGQTGEATPKPKAAPAAGTGTGQNPSNLTSTNNKTKDGYDVPEEGDLTDKPLGVLLSSARQRFTKPQFEIWKAREYPRMADEYTRRINDTLTKNPRYLSVLKPLVNRFPRAFSIDNGKFVINDPNLIPILSSNRYNGLIQGIMNNDFYKASPATPAQPQQ